MWQLKGGYDMLEFNTKVEIKALNFATLMNVLDCSEHKLDPLFTEFSKKTRVKLFVLIFVMYKMAFKCNGTKLRRYILLDRCRMIYGHI